MSPSATSALNALNTILALATSERIEGEPDMRSSIIALTEWSKYIAFSFDVEQSLWRGARNCRWAERRAPMLYALLILLEHSHFGFSLVDGANHERVNLRRVGQCLQIVPERGLNAAHAVNVSKATNGAARNA